MPNVVKTDIDALNAVLTITLSKEDYLTKVQQDIKKYAQRVAMKGFRPGKTPQGLVKKMYGSAFLMDAVQDMLYKTLGEYMEETKIDVLGQPMLSQEQPDNKLDIKNPTDISFKFDLGLVPEFDLQGLDGATFERYEVTVDPSKIDAELDNARRRAGEEQEVSNIQDGDMLFLAIKEVGGSIEKDLTVSMNWLTEEMQEVFKTQNKGSQLTINIFQLEKETTPQYVRKYFLGLEEDNDKAVNENFDVTITKITRMALGELTEEFLEKNFGVKTEEEARASINKNLNQTFEASADALLLSKMQERLMADNQIELPDTFLKRWLQTQNDKNTADVVEKGYASFAQNLRWTLIRSKVAKTSDINISDEDMKDTYRKKIKSYLGGMAVGEEFVESLVSRVMDDEKQFSELYEETMTDKTFEAMKLRSTILERPIGVEEFNSVMSTARYEAALARGEVQEAVPEEDGVELVEAEEVV
jgi:trigger factor